MRYLYLITGLLLIGCASPEGKSTEKEVILHEVTEEVREEPIVEEESELDSLQILPKNERNIDQSLDELLETIEIAITRKDTALLLSEWMKR